MKRTEKISKQVRVYLCVWEKITKNTLYAMLSPGKTFGNMGSVRGKMDLSPIQPRRINLQCEPGDLLALSITKRCKCWHSARPPHWDIEDPVPTISLLTQLWKLRRVSLTLLEVRVGDFYLRDPCINEMRWLVWKSWHDAHHIGNPKADLFVLFLAAASLELGGFICV